jgi:hypothetical protein
MRPRGRRHSLRSLYVPKDVAILSISKLTVLASATTTYRLVQLNLDCFQSSIRVKFCFLFRKKRVVEKSMDMVGVQGNPLAKHGSDRSAEKREQRGGRKKRWWDGSEVVQVHRLCTVTLPAHPRHSPTAVLLTDGGG